MVYLGFGSVRALLCCAPARRLPDTSPKQSPPWLEEKEWPLVSLSSRTVTCCLHFQKIFAFSLFDVKSKPGMPRKSREGHRFCLGFLLPWQCTNSCFYLPDGLCATGNSATLHHSGRVREELDTITSEPKAGGEPSLFKNALLLKPKNMWVPYFEGLFYLVFSLLGLLFLSGFSFPLWTCFSNSCLIKVWERCFRC